MVEYTLGKASLEDMYSVFILANDKTIRSMAVHEKQIEWNEHVAWFSEKLTSEQCSFYIVKAFNQKCIGYIRLDEKGNAWIISLAIGIEYRGQSLGASLLQDIIAIEKDKKLVAFVKEHNIVSQKCFIRAGFVKVEELEVKNSMVRLYQYEVRR